MQKSRIFGLFALAVLSIFLVSTVSAYSFWSPQYETYRLGSAAHGNGAYSSTSTYEKVVVENEDRYGSDKLTTVKKSESESYTPTRSNSYSRNSDRSYNYDNYDIGYRYNDNLGRARTYVKNGDFLIYDDDGIAYPSTNWRYQEMYHNYDYPNENDYGHDYYYSPRYDWHQQIYNWRY